MSDKSPRKPVPVPGAPRGVRTVKVDFLARVEGEGGVLVKLRDGRVTEVQLKIFEPPRFFEGFLRGRRLGEVPDITARICGICPVAYQVSSVNAMEAALGIRLDEPLKLLRRLLYCGEWIESHALHIYLLHAPDFLGYPSGIHMAQDHGAEVQRGLEIKKTGNALVTAVGGREIHPVNVRVGGFHRAPSKKTLRELLPALEKARDDSLATIRWVSGFEFPELVVEHELVALRSPDVYAIEDGRVVSSSGLDMDPSEYEKHFSEEQSPHSNALHSRRRGGDAPYQVGPLARYSLNFDRLSPDAQRAAREVGLGPTCHEPFKSIVVRAVELFYACEEAIRLVQAYEPPEKSFREAEPREADGHGVSEAPRGLLYHRYRLSAEGLVVAAKIVPPTSQNQRAMEADLAVFAGARAAQPLDRLTLGCEHAVRNYDPCISCATHVLRVKVDRE
ncbi:MAG: Ni/Fe hydrogenase subunit alpha [Candidatus Eisenbacteria bacterium]|nr:Ni/Fe hydrogenase subunit alpha [Candidatus Eisenbacteria bacterium]